MRASLRNAWYGLVDYAAYPLTLLAIAPVLLRHLGAAGYGIFAFSMATVNAASIVASGFGDANVQEIAKARAERNTEAIHQTIRCTMGIQLVLGTTIALVGILLSSPLAARVTLGDPAELETCILVLRTACVLVLLRTVETVAVSTQRAFEAYDEAIRVSASFRVASLLAAGLLTWRGGSLEAIVLTMAVLSTISTAVQLFRVARRTSFLCLVPSLERQRVSQLAAFGGFTWLQATAGVIVGRLDRIVVGLCMGSAAVAAYSFASQLAQPIAGSSASGFHFLFPHLAHRVTDAGVNAIRRPIIWAVACNALVVTIETVPMLLFGHWILQRWVGVQMADAGTRVLPLLVLASALTGLSVTGNYALLALGRVRAATWITLSSSGIMLAAATVLTPMFGATGMSLARLGCGAASLMVYLPLWRHLNPGGDQVAAIPTPVTAERGAYL